MKEGKNKGRKEGRRRKEQRREGRKEGRNVQRVVLPQLDNLVIRIHGKIEAESSMPHNVLTFHGIYNGWILQQMDFTADRFYIERIVQRMDFTTDGF
jgi:hypothetical protein